jgi:hypothetical protein
MDDLHAVLNREAGRVRPSDDWFAETLSRVRRRQRFRRFGTVIVALAVAGAGLYLAVRAFDSGNRRLPASDPSANYRFTHVSVTLGEAGSTPAQGQEGFATIWYAFDWDEYPGVRECIWEVFDDSGRSIGARTELFGPESPVPDLHRGRPKNAVELRISGVPADARIRCGAERLDTPGIGAVRPYPENLTGSQLEEEFASRLEEWKDRFRIWEMGLEELDANVIALRRATSLVVDHSSVSGDQRNLLAGELSARARAIQACQRERAGRSSLGLGSCRPSNSP